MSIQQATVQTLTAEVRVLFVGSRQITLSVYRQLDKLPVSEVAFFEPFGRVRASRDDIWTRLVGRDVRDGTLVRYTVHGAGWDREIQEWVIYDRSGCIVSDRWAELLRLKNKEFEALPLIVLAGLR